jgi:hypothetical protein
VLRLALVTKHVLLRCSASATLLPGELPLLLAVQGYVRLDMQPAQSVRIPG